MFGLENLVDEKEIYISLPQSREVWPTYFQGHMLDIYPSWVFASRNGEE